MSAKMEIDDDEATLSLARQIGLKLDCNPSLMMPKTDQKYSIAHWKLVHKYFLTRQMRMKDTESKSKRKEEASPKRHMNQNMRSTGFSFADRKLHTSEKRSRGSWGQEYRVQTARTTQGKRTRIFADSPSQLSHHHNKSTLSENKTLLFELWHQQNHNKVNPELILNRSSAKRPFQKSNPKRKNQIHIKFNAAVKSFQFC